MNEPAVYDWKFEYFSDECKLKLTTHQNVLKFNLSCKFYYKYCYTLLEGERSPSRGDDFDANNFTLKNVDESYGIKLLYLLSVMSGETIFYKRSSTFVHFEYILGILYISTREEECLNYDEDIFVYQFSCSESTYRKLFDQILSNLPMRDDSKYDDEWSYAYDESDNEEIYTLAFPLEDFSSFLYLLEVLEKLDIEF